MLFFPTCARLQGRSSVLVVTAGFSRAPPPPPTTSPAPFFYRTRRSFRMSPNEIFHPRTPRGNKLKTNTNRIRRGVEKAARRQGGGAQETAPSAAAAIRTAQDAHA